MKKILFIFALFITNIFGVSAQENKLETLFDKYQDTEGVTSIKIAKPMFGMLSKLDIKDSELDQIKPILNKINGLKILILEKPETNSAGKTQSGIYQNLSSEISNSLKDLNLQELMTVNSKDAKIKFLSTEVVNGMMNNLLLNINSGDNIVLMKLDGKISMDDVNKLIEESQKYNSQNDNVITENVSSEGVTQVRSVESFIGIEASNGVKVNFTQGEKQSVIVETDTDLQQYVRTEVVNNTLKIYVDSKGKRNLHFKKLVVNVQAPHLKTLKTSSGSSFVAMNDIKEDMMQISSSSGSTIKGNFAVHDNFLIEASSGSSLKLSLYGENMVYKGSSGSSSEFGGEIENATFDISSGASSDAENLKIKLASIKASSASSAKIYSTETLAAVASSSATVKYKGNPKNITVQNSSGGSIKPF